MPPASVAQAPRGAVGAIGDEYVHALDGRTNEALKIIGRLKSESEGDRHKNAIKLARIYLALGENNTAYKYLDKASRDPEDGNHIEIWDHVADCLVALDKKKEAVEVWTKALKLEDLTKRDAERRKKITEKLKKTKAELAK